MYVCIYIIYILICIKSNIHSNTTAGRFENWFLTGSGVKVIFKPFFSHAWLCSGDDIAGQSHSSSSSSYSKKQRKARTAFSDNQLQTLESSFERQKYLSVQDRMELAAKLSLTDTQVKTWYQNRR